MRLLGGDVIAVIKHLRQQKAIVVGHDWGGMVAWQLAMNVPDVVDRLIILNLPHPRGLAHNPDQQKNNWDFVERDVTLTTVPTAGHFVQADEPEFVTKTMRAWLLR